MSRKVCKHELELSPKLVDRSPKYKCKKCNARAHKDKWLCKPKAL